jgi:hypothetical protein
MVYAARYSFKNDEPVREEEYFVGDVRELTKIIKTPVVLTGQNANYYRDIIFSNNEPVGDKPESGAGQNQGESLHNIKEMVKNEPARIGDDKDISRHSGTKNTNEPVQSGNVDDVIRNYKDYSKNEPAGAEAVYEVSKSDIITLENETAGAWVAALALLRLQRGMGDNPWGLSPMYLKESTARVFMNKYTGNKG